MKIGEVSVTHCVEVFHFSTENSETFTVQSCDREVLCNLVRFYDKIKLINFIWPDKMKTFYIIPPEAKHVWSSFFITRCPVIHQLFRYINDICIYFIFLSLLMLVTSSFHLLSPFTTCLAVKGPKQYRVNAKKWLNTK